MVLRMWCMDTRAHQPQADIAMRPAHQSREGGKKQVKAMQAARLPTQMASLSWQESWGTGKGRRPGGVSGPTGPAPEPYLAQ